MSSMSAPQKQNASSFLVILSFATVYIVWGSTYFFILKALEGFKPMVLGALRFIIAGGLMLLWCFIKGEKLFVLNDMKHAAVSGLLMLGVGTGVVIWVEQYLASALVAILISAAPMYFVLMDYREWKTTFTNKLTVLGLMTGFAGIILLFKEKIDNIFSANNNYTELKAMLLLIVGNICWTLGSMNSKYKATSGSNTVNVAWQMIAASVPFIPLSFLLNEPQQMQWNNISPVAWFSLFYLILFGSIAAYTAYVWLLQVRPSAQVSTYAYVNPVVAVLLGVFFASETISFLQMLGLAIILGSVLMINLAKYRVANKSALKK
jgi:drug/metabolite transporter (DMT)-like permease